MREIRNDEVEHAIAVDLDLLSLHVEIDLRKELELFRKKHKNEKV